MCENDLEDGRFDIKANPNNFWDIKCIYTDNGANIIAIFEIRYDVIYIG